MNRTIRFTVLAAAAVALCACGGSSGQEETSTSSAHALTGNGGPSGPHYDLNIIGVSNPKQISNSGGNVIFVPLSGSCKIDLVEGSTFAVLDDNCTDDGVASFQLPNPDPTNSGQTTYSVFARALGAPGGTSTTTTCATDPTTGTVYCSIYSSVLVRTSGKQSFTNVSKELLYVYAAIGDSGTVQRFPLFDTALQDYFWDYQNGGLRLAQLRFYQVSTNVN
ncbi:MAG TPA: hypothetical protein VF765_21570 [Polyangiaceae bacterium]